MPLATSWTPWTIFVALVQVALIEVIDYCTSILIQMPGPVKCQAPGVSRPGTRIGRRRAASPACVEALSPSERWAVWISPRR